MVDYVLAIVLVCATGCSSPMFATMKDRLARATGCSSRMFVTIGKDAEGREFGVPMESVYQYADEHRITYDQALAKMRAETKAKSKLK